MYTHTHTQQGQSEKFYHKEQQNSYITRTHRHTHTKSHSHPLRGCHISQPVSISSNAFEIEIASAPEEKEVEGEEENICWHLAIS